MESRGGMGAIPNLVSQTGCVNFQNMASWLSESEWVPFNLMLLVSESGAFQFLNVSECCFTNWGNQFLNRAGIVSPSLLRKSTRLKQKFHSIRLDNHSTVQSHSVWGAPSWSVPAMRQPRGGVGGKIITKEHSSATTKYYFLLRNNALFSCPCRAR